MTEYVAGFMYDPDGHRVALVRKNRPAWQAGKLNGIGGHIEPNEVPIAAMAREFKEETGFETTPTQWWPFAVLGGDDWKVHFFSTIGPVDELQTMTDEEIVVTDIERVTVQNAIPNLTWLMPMSKSILHDRATCLHITEEY